MGELIGISFWCLSIGCAGLGVRELLPIARLLTRVFGIGKTIRAFQIGCDHVYHLQETLESGLVPEPEDWKRLHLLPGPWNEITYKNVMELRDQGAPVLPTLKRIRAVFEEQIELMQESQAKSSQAWSQALLGLFIIPVFSFLIYEILPQAQEQTKIYFCVSAFSFTLALIAAAWIGAMVERTRFGNIKPECQDWYGHALAMIERLWALIKTGIPADLAWKQSAEELSHTDPLLAQSWGLTVWSTEQKYGRAHRGADHEFERLILNLGIEIKNSIQTSLIEGRGCLERMEGIHRAFLTEYRLKLLRQLNLLPNRCLKPLFLFLFPAILLVLITALILVAQSSGGF